MKISTNGLRLIQYYEGFKNKPYRDCAGLWTVGVGHLIGDGRSLPDSWSRTFSLEEIDALLREDLARIERRIGLYVSVPLAQHQYDSIISFVFNLGMGAFQRSTLRRKLNRGDILGASKEFLKYNKAGGIVRKGLIRRRESESNLFLYSVWR